MTREEDPSHAFPSHAFPAQTERVEIGEARSILLAGDLEILGLIQDSSNYTFLVRVGPPDRRVVAVYKPQAGEAPLWDFPDGTLYKREVAAFEASEAAGFSFIPPTIVRDGPHGLGSVQLFIDADTTLHYLNMPPEFDDAFRRVCAFDLVINNADRKAGHCLLEKGTGRVWFIDHGVSFHLEPKLRTVIWDYAGEPIPPDVMQGIGRLLGRLESEPLLDDLLNPGEVEVMRVRARAVLDAGVFPEPGPGRPYPWPPV